jgi:thiamine-phosphate pyrophosphorylase
VKQRLAGLYAVTPDMADTEALCALVRDALVGGARAIQYRNKTASASLRRTQATRLHAVCSEHAVPLIVNDDVELALEIGAEGVHLGRDDGSVAAARAHLGPERLLGASCYDSLARAQAAIGEGADHVAFGAAYPSTVKPAAIRAGADVFRAARARFDVPIVAIGGITAANAPALIEVGVDALAVISAVFGATNVREAARSFSVLFEQTV